MSYREYVSRFLDREALKEKNRNAPEDQKFCNAICQDYAPKTIFSGQHVICNPCRNKINLAINQVQAKTITMEEFKRNPMIVYGVGEGMAATKECGTCKEEKSVCSFETNRKECKSCRSLQAAARIHEKVKEYISDIEKIKMKLPDLENYLGHIPKDALILVIAHYQVGRKSTDMKSTMIVNMMKHFKSLLSPNMCKGGCGSTVVTAFSTCGKCLDHPICRKNEKKEDFRENLDKLVEELKPMRNRVVDIDQFNKEKLTMIARKLDLKFEQILPKAGLFDIVNEALEKREREKVREDLEAKEIIPMARQIDHLIIDGFTIEARDSDCYINATMLCQAGNKRFFDWYRLDMSTNLIETLSTETGIPVSDLVDVKKGGIVTNGSQGSWIHPDLAVQLAQWISPLFALRVSRWVREIVITGEAQRDDEKTNEQLITLQMELQQKNAQLKKLENNHKILKKCREYHKLKKGPAFYILRPNSTDFKLGYEGVDINQRLRAHRTTAPNLKVCYIVFTPDADLLERCMLLRFGPKKLENNHEFITDVSLAELTGSVHANLSLNNYEYTVCPDKEIEAYNES
jgi:hypothetical protein